MYLYSTGQVALNTLLLSMVSTVCQCGGLTLAGCQTPTQLLPPSPSSMGWGERRRWKNVWVETETGRSLTNYHHRQNRLDLSKNNLIVDVAGLTVWKTSSEKVDISFKNVCFKNKTHLKLLISGTSTLLQHSVVNKHIHLRSN